MTDLMSDEAMDSLLFLCPTCGGLFYRRKLVQLGPDSGLCQLRYAPTVGVRVGCHCADLALRYDQPPFDVESENAQMRAEQFDEDMSWPPESDEPVCPECGGHGSTRQLTALLGTDEILECLACRLAAIDGAQA